MKLLPTFVYLTFCFTACGQNNCKATDYRGVNWQVFDSITSYHICSNSDNKLSGDDFLKIEYLGALKRNENTIIQREADKEMFSLLTNTKFGRFKCSETNLSNDIKFIIKQMTKKSEAIIKYDLGSLKPLEPERKITVYFTDATDSTTAIKWSSDIKKKPFVDSTYYLSRNAALQKWSKDENDTSWLSLIKANPLPSSVDIFFKPNYFNSKFIDSLKNEFTKSNIVSDVMYVNSLTDENLRSIKQTLNKIYLIKINAKK